MIYQAQRDTKGASILASVAAGVLIAWMIILMGSTVITMLVAKEQMVAEAIKPSAVIVMFIAAFLSALVAGKKVREKRMLVCLGTSGIYYLSLVCCNMLFFNGEFSGLFGAMLTVAGSGLIAGLLQMKQKRQKPSYLKSVRKLKIV